MCDAQLIKYIFPAFHLAKVSIQYVQQNRSTDPSHKQSKGDCTCGLDFSLKSFALI